MCDDMDSSVTAIALARNAVKRLCAPRIRRDRDIHTRWHFLCENAIEYGYNAQQLLCLMILLEHDPSIIIANVGDEQAWAVRNGSLFWAPGIEFKQVVSMPTPGDVLVVCDAASWLRELLTDHWLIRKHDIELIHHERHGRMLIRLTEKSGKRVIVDRPISRRH